MCDSKTVVQDLIKQVADALMTGKKLAHNLAFTEQVET